MYKNLEIIRIGGTYQNLWLPIRIGSKVYRRYGNQPSTISVSPDFTTKVSNNITKTI